VEHSPLLHTGVSLLTEGADNSIDINSANPVGKMIDMFNSMLGSLDPSYEVAHTF
jgi:hypothetical protein